MYLWSFQNELAVAERFSIDGAARGVAGSVAGADAQQLTPIALEEVAAIHQRLAEHTEAAECIEAAVFDSLNMLAEFPQFGRKTDENGVHRWPMKDFLYTIFYRINGQVETLEVLRASTATKRVRDLNRVPW